jgi:hypothetical protein
VNPNISPKSAFHHRRDIRPPHLRILGPLGRVGL